jgi:Flp pilus assembly protein TadD
LRLLLAFFVVVVIAVGSYFGYKQYVISRHAASVRALFASRRYDDAAQALPLWLAESPDSAEAHYYKAWLALVRDQPADVIEESKKAKNLGYDDTALNCLRGVFLARAGRLNEAEPILEPAFLADSEPRLEIARELAKLYLATFRLAQAAPAIERARILAPEDPMPYLWLNEIASRDGGNESTLIQNYLSALERKPDLDKARLGLAEQLSKARRFDDALVEYRTYLERNPRSTDALVGLGRTYFQRGDLEDARKSFESALAVDPRQPDALKELGQIDLRLGRFSQACERLRLLCETQPYEYEFRYSYSQALKLAGDSAGAQRESDAATRLRKEQDRILQLRSVVLRDPSNVDARFEVARWMLENGHEKSGLDWTSVILNGQPRHAPTHRLLAEYYRKKGESSRGLANYHEFMATSAQDGEAAGDKPKPSK